MTESNLGEQVVKNAAIRDLGDVEIATIDEDKMVAENSASANRLADGQFLVDVGKNLIPAE